MKKKFILGLDEGTTSVRAVVYDVTKNEIVYSVSKKFKQYYPKEAWVEHDAEEIYEASLEVLNEAIKAKKLKREELFGLGITNQRESVVAWNKKTGQPICHSIVWQCRRTAEFCESLSAKNKKLIKEKTGLIVDAYFSASKIKWILDNVSEARELEKQNNLCFGTMETFLTYRFTNGKSYVSDVTNASRTMLFNISTLDWDDKLLKLFGISREVLPKIVSNAEVVGSVNTDIGKIKIGALIGDQQSALFGQGCHEVGMVKNTYGTGCFLLCNVGKSPVKSKNLLTDVAWKIGDEVTYALEGSVFNAGSIMTWLEEDMGLISSAKETEAIAKSISSTEGTFFVPAFTGMGAPYWDPYARGMLAGMTRATTKAHVVRACLESMAYRTQDILNEIKKITELRCDGGVSNNGFLMQFQSNLSKVTVKRQKSTEATVLGAVYMAGLTLGAFKSVQNISQRITFTKVFTPKEDNSIDIKGWKKAVAKCLYKEEK